MNKKVEAFDIEANIIKCDVSYRGGVLKIDVSELFPNVEEAIMGASQNYLGGGIAGAIVAGAMFDVDELESDDDKEVFFELKEKIKKYFYEINNGGGDEYMVDEVNSYKQNQGLPVSAY